MMAYLIKHRAIPASKDLYQAKAEQGHAVNRPGKVYLEAIPELPIGEVWVGGEAIQVARMEINI